LSHKSSTACVRRVGVRLHRDVPVPSAISPCACRCERTNPCV
jgi:hypothetical protein